MFDSTHRWWAQFPARVERRLKLYASLATPAKPSYEHTDYTLSEDDQASRERTGHTSSDAKPKQNDVTNTSYTWLPLRHWQAQRTTGSLSRHLFQVTDTENFLYYCSIMRVLIKAEQNFHFAEQFLFCDSKVVCIIIICWTDCFAELWLGFISCAWFKMCFLQKLKNLP